MAVNIYSSPVSVSVSIDWVQSVAAGTPKAQPQKKKIDEFHLVNMKSFSASENTIKK